MGKMNAGTWFKQSQAQKLVYGHTAMTPEEFAEKIDTEAWSDLFTEVPVKAGDFFGCSKWDDSRNRRRLL